MENIFNILDKFVNNDFVYTYPTKDYKVKENTNDYVLELQVPGYSKEDLTISFEKDLLTISYDGEETNDDQWKKKFKRSFQRADNIDANKSYAELQKGILKITLPKKEDALPKKIAIT